MEAEAEHDDGEPEKDSESGKVLKVEVVRTAKGLSMG